MSLLMSRCLRTLRTVIIDCACARDKIIHQPQIAIEIKLTLGDLEDSSEEQMWDASPTNQ